MEKKVISKVTNRVSTSIMYDDGSASVYSRNNGQLTSEPGNIATEWTPSPLDYLTESKLDAGKIHLKDVINDDNVDSIKIHSFKNPDQ